ncbi:MAG TPA: flagellar hook capping FlgD N-terminal domain-containing protein [Nitrospirota bacterium]|nr:flagellar hook capping FlgD N-terminal domain-containing protein [Nitrospirota bacterium]
MDIGSTTTTTGAASGSSTVPPSQELGKDDFLKLFMAQLQAQDPLNPMDSSQFTTQLAQFSSLEQLTNINTQLTSLVQVQSSQQNATATDLIGKQVQLTTGAYHTVTGVLFGNNQTLLELEDGSTIQPGAIMEIRGGA